MASLSADRPSEVVLAARVARQFYLEGVSKVDIADRLGISRFRVARLLDSARESGLVRIEIGLPGGALDAGLSAELCSVFGLRHAFVFNFPEDESPLRQRLGEAAGQVLMDLITPGDVLGLTWSRTLSGLTAALTQLPPCPIVQLTGAVPPPDGRDLLELVRGVARVGGGTAHVFYAPMLVDDAATATAIRRQSDIAEAFALIPSVTIAVVVDRRLGTRAVHDLRRDHPGRARGTRRGRRARGAGRGVHRRRRPPAGDTAGQPDDRRARSRCSRRSRSSLASPTTPPRAPRCWPRSEEGLSMAWSRTPVSPEACSAIADGAAHRGGA